MSTDSRGKSTVVYVIAFLMMLGGVLVALWGLFVWTPAAGYLGAGIVAYRAGAALVPDDEAETGR